MVQLKTILNIIKTYCYLNNNNKTKIMNKLFTLAIVLLLASCKTEEWNKENAKKKCLESAKSEMYNEASTKRVTAICDCIAEKTIATFANEEEANNKMLDVVYITNDCRNDFDKAKVTADSLFYEQNPDLKYMKNP